MAKIFISYKYGDNQVDQNLDQKYWAIEKDPFTGRDRRLNMATGRAYVNYLEEIIGKDNILKSEEQNESLKGKSEKQIWEILKPKVHDSSVTLIVISRGMKDSLNPENEQWMPQEIRYSLWEIDRGEKTSATNALLGVIIPDHNGRYDYIYGKSNCPHCTKINLIDKNNNPHLFKILKGNLFNRKSDNGKRCDGNFCNTVIYDDGHSYLHLVTLEDFIKDNKYQEHIDKALKIKESGDSLYNIEKSI